MYPFDCKCDFENCNEVKASYKFLQKIIDSKEICEYNRNYFEEKLKSKSKNFHIIY